jgi:hypothetical protein
MLVADESRMLRHVAQQTPVCGAAIGFGIEELEVCYF